MLERDPIGYVVQVARGEATINIASEFQTRVFAHEAGVSRIGQPGDMLGVGAGNDIIVLVITELRFTDTAQLQRSIWDSDHEVSPLQQFVARPVGYISGSTGQREFNAGLLQAPFLGSSVFPLSDEELKIVSNPTGLHGDGLLLGSDANDATRDVRIDIDTALGRHIAVVGATGQGKTHLVVNMLKQLLAFPKSRMVVFDINGEYEPAFRDFERVRVSSIGGNAENRLRLRYPALGQRGLTRLLLPSERAQAPMLRFALDNLARIEGGHEGARLVGSHADTLFDDCRPGTQDELREAKEAIDALRSGSTDDAASKWPHMNALACLIAEGYALQPGRYGPERNYFQYGHVSTLINRIKTLWGDPRFTAIVDIDPDGDGEPLSMESESRQLITSIFGPADAECDWALHIVDMSVMAPDLMPYILGAILEQYAQELFTRGPANSMPTLLVLEEAHHYLRSVVAENQEGPMAYERLAKEGRKFGLSLLVSTQRPSELSETVLAQCGTFLTFRLGNRRDKAIVEATSDDRNVHFQDLSTLQRGEIIASGVALNFPTRVLCLRADPPPKSPDPQFIKEWTD